MNNLAQEYVPRPGEFDPLASNPSEGDASAAHSANAGSAVQQAQKPRTALVQFYKPSELKAYEPPPNQNLVGDYHIQRGAPAVLAGPGGVGKSRAALWLAMLGARGGGNWFGMEVRSQFRTLWLQSENGLPRLHRDVKDVPGLEMLDDWIRISAFPSFRSFDFQNRLFRDAVKTTLCEFQPNLVILDPWNQVARDGMEKDYQEAFVNLREVLADVPSEPALLIIAHLRKPKAEDRHRGRSLANLLAGSYVLQSVPRSVLVMQSASDDTDDARVVLTPAKNNDGPLGKRTAWERRSGLFEPVPLFDFEGFDAGGAKHEPKVKEEHIRELFENGRRRLKLSQAAEALQGIAPCGRSAAYDALSLNGRYGHLLTEKEGLLGLKPGGESEEDG